MGDGFAFWHQFERLMVRVRLSFESPLDEAEFVDSYVLRLVRINQIFLAVGAIAYATYYIWDQIMDPNNHHIATMIRIFFAGPILLGCAASLSFTPFIRHVEKMVTVSGVAIFVAQAWIYVVLDHGFNYAVMGFALSYLAFATTFTIRVRYLIFLALVAIACAVGGHIIAANAAPGWLIINVMGVSGSVMIGMVSATIRERAARAHFINERALAETTARADELLHSILPGNIVERIQQGETEIADILGEVSIVFADLAGFTSLSRRLSPPDLIRLLDEIFSRFDRIAKRYSMDKISTIGDAYLAVGGTARVDIRPDPAQNAGHFALAIQAEVKKMIIETGYPIALRVGIHIGKVVTGVVGVKRPSFYCWGEAVDLANGLEGRAPPGGILISDSAYERLRHCFATSPARYLELKGVAGRNRVRLLLGPIANDQAAPPADANIGIA